METVVQIEKITSKTISDFGENFYFEIEISF